MKMLWTLSGYNRAIFTRDFCKHMAVMMVWFFFLAVLARYLIMPVRHFDLATLFIGSIATYVGIDVAYFLGSIRRRQHLLFPASTKQEKIQYFCFDAVPIVLGFVLDCALNNNLALSFSQALVFLVLIVGWYFYGYYRQSTWEKENKRRHTTFQKRGNV